ncbi:MAG: sulfotransferase [Geodermatophilaceae bacterium]|nr:sulfotransferase [Geodermatophilaceae bacterium]
MSDLSPGAPTPTRSAAPDLVIVGAARSGTSFLAAQLSTHPRIDPGSVKEPNYYSRHLDRGDSWYDDQFGPRAPGVLRMDASVSYTYPQFPDALSALAGTGNDPYVVYLVRDPVPRAVSHYLYYKHYFKQEHAETFGEALRNNPLYVGASDYEAWLRRLSSTFGTDRLLVVPFAAATKAADAVAAQICSALGLPPMPEPDPDAGDHQNNVVTFKHPALRFASRKLRRSRFYPLVREKLGAGRLRRVRSLVTKNTALPSAAEVLAGIDAGQAEQMRALERRCDIAVRAALAEQDARLGLSWSAYWTTPDALPRAAA